jgi:hypothetical protein
MQHVILAFVGDLPAREFETGNAGGGDYPCHCGRHSDCFTKPSQLFLDPPYNSLQQRISLINKTSNPQEGVYPDKMKVSSVKSCKFAKCGDWYLNPEACQYWSAQRLGEFSFLFYRMVLKHNYLFP